MESTIAAQCIVEQDTGLELNMAGNKLPAGSVMCKLTAFVIMEHGDIDYIGGCKMEMVYQASDWYCEFLDQQVKELHMERRQGFITSLFRALTGRRHKTRRKQVTGIPPMLVTIWSYTPATSIDDPSTKTLSEDVTQAELVARLPSPVPTNEEPAEESSTNNQLGEYFQHNGYHIPFHCTDMEAHKHLTNHFSEHLSNKVYNTFKDLFSNINLDSTQETYQKISIYNKIIAQFVEETNLKYGLDLKFTKLEAPEVGLWVKTFQVAGHSKDQQLPRQLVLPQHL